MTETPEQHARANPGHVITAHIEKPATCDRGDFRSPLIDLARVVKWGGFETRTHQEALRRQARAEAAQPLFKRAAAEMASVFDNRVKPAPWDNPDADPIGDMRRAIEADVDRLARERARQMDDWLAPHMAAIQELRDAGRGVWLEESPPELEADPDGGPHAYRATSTTRLRYTGDGLD